MMTFIAAFAVQLAAGVLIGAYPAPGGGLYSAEGHQMALTIFICIEVAGLTYFLWPRRKLRVVP